MFRTVKQVAEHLGVSIALVYNWVESGLLTCLRLGGEGRRGTIRIDDTDLDGFLDSRRTKPQQPATKRAGT
jgi:excisionase family DNA binding protein